jgi:hypothetical protein
MAANQKKNPSRGRGRPTKLTPEITKVVVTAIAAGNFMETAWALAGISRETATRWLRQGSRARGGAHREFRDAVFLALAQHEAGLVGVLTEAARGDRDEKGNLKRGTDNRPLMPADIKAAQFLLTHGPGAPRWRAKHELDVPEGTTLAPLVVYLPAEDRE